MTFERGFLAAAGTIPKPTIWHPCELVAAEFPEPEGFLLGSIIARQSVALFAGWRGVGKTWISMKYGAAVASNGSQFGHMPTRVVLVGRGMRITDGLVILRMKDFQELFGKIG